MTEGCPHPTESRVGRSEWTDPLDGRRKATVERRCETCDRSRWTVEPINADLTTFGGASE